MSIERSTTTTVVAPYGPPAVAPGSPPTAVDRPTTATSSSTSTSAPAPPPVVPPTRGENEVTVGTGPATATTEPPAEPATTTVAGESMAPGTYVEPTDAANAYHVAADGTTRASAIEIARRAAPERADVTVMYYGTVVEVQLTNLADRTIALPDGYTAAVECQRDGVGWRTGTASQPAITSAEPGATVSATLELAADGTGTYTCAATVEIVLP